MAEEKDFEMVSAAMDGELSDEEFDRVLKSGDVQERWYQYHLIRDYLQHSRQAVGKDIEFTSQASFLAKLSEITQERQVAVRSEQVKQKSTLTHHAVNNHSFRWFSIAASVLAAAVITWQMLPGGNASEGGVTVEAKKQAQPSDSSVVPVAAKPAAAIAAGKEDGVVMPNAAVDQNNAEIKSAVQVEKPVEDKSKQSNEIKQIAQ
ncbi:MAG: sigma-E factor negative regulatory protein [Neisseria sp.]|uniref:sigma-E factor negative regulatory protein n=1 Tax=Neisseria sp. TaxID=192066 RepID=UPI0026DB6C23|nr:sigma-E factor negative regulatory protein [Neisseria sp.]MDO4642187.1 sigma-E factor negative regulatory protein [Neisseria sp.]